MKITEDCVSCGTCVDACSIDGSTESGETYLITVSCKVCRTCLDVCPVDAIVD